MIARLAGWVISIACLVFFVRHVQQVGLSTPGRSVGENAAFVLVCSVAYAAAVGILALAWARMLRSAIPAGRSIRPLVTSYLIGQFAKYLPGNVLQYAARHGLGITAGASHPRLVAAAFAEIYLLVCCGAAVAMGAGMPAISSMAPEWPVLPMWLGLLPLVAGFSVSVPAKLLPSQRWLPELPTSTVAIAMGGYLGFFVIFGGLYWLCLAWSTQVAIMAGPAIGTAAVAWLAGFVIPGAPAGAGLREAALSLGMGPSLPAAGVSAAIVLFRLISLSGDFVAFITGWLLTRRGRHHGTPATPEPKGHP
ncbi:hypothetical protein [Lysobacter sp. A289]